ncbi:branched-chain amino acid ABC transporter permease [uncultured Pseudacidovorax sp.]|uniref:branched-chain amino acid ABC transporter permease n=1 Tax=uncultured Pseudacidovorax sp. TaxID=679313 RepID=UPI0025FEB8A5|nr:branched-chain amino acid ABC transporter permease [uncultured Pseudacidovorax sp.]
MSGTARTTGLQAGHPSGGAHPVKTPRRQIAAEVAFWAALAGSFFLMPEQLTLMSQVLIFGLFAVSLDMALGYAGILTVGHAAFFGAGAYGAGLLAKHGWGEPISGLAVALAVGLALGWLLSWLVVRGTDLARLMITIAVCVLLYELANRLSAITGGTDGLQGMAVSPLLGRFEFDFFGRTAFIYSFVVVLGVFLVVRRVLRSPFGMALRGIHDNRKRMLALGTPVDARLRMAYAFSAGVAAIAGALLAQTTQFVGIESIGFNRSAEVLIILVLGGTGRLYGGMLGAVVYMLVHDRFADMNPQYWMFWLGLFLIGAVLVGRGGLMGLLARLTQGRRRDAGGAA